LWHHPEEFKAKMPKSVLQSNWHYWSLAGEDGTKGTRGYGYRAYFDLEALGYDQVPTTTTWNHVGNTRQVMAELAKAKMKGIVGWMTAPWMMTLPEHYYDILGDVARLGFARKEFGSCFDN
jgi:hypothetical protein